MKAIEDYLKEGYSYGFVDGKDAAAGVVWAQVHKKGHDFSIQAHYDNSIEGKTKDEVLLNLLTDLENATIK